MVDPGQQPGHGGLAGARVAHEHQVEGHGGHGQAVLLAQPAHLHQIDEALYVGLHLVQAAQAVQLGQQLLQAGGGLGLLLGLFLPPGLPRRGGSRLLRPGGGGFRLGLFGDEVLHVQGGLLPLEAVPVAQGGEGVGAGVDKPGLLLADRVIHGGEEQYHQGHQIDEPPGQAGARHLVAGPHPGEEVGHPEAGVLADGGGQLPEQDGRHRVALGVDGVIVFHIAGGGRGPVPLPHPQGAGPHEGVHLLGELHPQGGVGDLAAEGGDPVAVLLMHLGGAERTFQSCNTSFFG